jgi:Tol biopolymer transport system component
MIKKGVFPGVLCITLVFVLATTALPTFGASSGQKEMPTPEATPSTAQNINPLTGLPVDDPAVLRRRPLNVRIGNDPQIRPQIGLDQADLVYEEIMEGYWVTRFTAVFLSQDPEAIGPVRSARLVNLELTPQFDAALAHSGASDHIRWAISQTDIVDLDEFYSRTPYYYREGYDWRGRLCTSAELLRTYMEEHNLEQAVPLTGSVFSPEIPSGVPARRISIPYRGNSSVSYRYQPASGRYLRFVQGQPHLDGSSQKQLSAANVIVQHVPHLETDIVEDSLGSTSIRIILTGQGQAEIFRDGVMIKGLWRREERKEMTRYLDREGKPIPLKPGNSWIQLVPTTMAIEVGGREVALDNSLNKAIIPPDNPAAETPAAVEIGGRIAFASNIEGSLEICILEANNSEPIPVCLTEDPAEDWKPAWSPDGNRLAFVSNRSGEPQIYVVGADGADLTCLTEGAGRNWAPAWSPDGTRLAFVSDRDGQAEIYIMEADGSNPTRLTDDPAHDLDPVWSPDNTRIAFVSTCEGDADIYLMEADGSNPINLNAADPTYEAAPAWSPDGRLAFTSNRDGNMEIYVMEADGSNPIRLTDDPAYDTNPVWSPDGHYIAFHSERDGAAEIYIMGAKGSNPLPLTENDVDDWYPVWGP